MSPSTLSPRHVDEQLRIVRRTWFGSYAAALCSGLLIVMFARRRLTEPFLGVTLGILALAWIGWVIRPRLVLYLTIFLTAISDIVTVSWFPFVKNFSSRESISFVADALTISPLDISLFIGFSVTALRQYAHTGRLLAPSRLKAGIVVFTWFVVFGFVRGVVMAGGDLRIAVLEGRALFYLLLVFGIAVNTLETDDHVRHALWWLLSGVFIQVLFSIEFLSRLDDATRARLESLNEHGSAIGHNLLILTLISLFVLRARAPLARLALMLALVPTIYVYIAAQRRSAIASLAVAIVLLLVMLFWRERRRFWTLAPLTVLFSIAYLAVFWNSQSGAAFPAQAIKTAISPEAASAADQSSDLYRTIESYDLIFTIRTDPFKGLGFGKAFYRPVPLPALENFELGAYLPHNSILWLWIKVGFFGFVAMFYVFGKSLMLGAERLRRLPAGADVIPTAMASIFIAMFAIYTYVDVSWDARNMVFFGLACMICGRPYAAELEAAADPDRRSVDALPSTDLATDADQTTAHVNA